MSAVIGGADLDSRSPRADAGLLWALEADSTGCRLLVRAARPIPATARDGVVLAPAEEFVDEAFAVGESLRLDIDLERSFTPFVAPPAAFVAARRAGAVPGGCTRTRREPVPLDGTGTCRRWLDAKLARAGLVITGDADLTEFTAAIGDHRIPALSVSARVEVTDPAALSAACAGGLGRGKNYGLGLLRLRRY